jgi:hypothetical protein
MTEGPMTTGRMLAGYLTRPGLLALRSRLSSSQEFKPTPQREWLCLRVEEALGMRRDVPGSLAELDDVGDLPEPGEQEPSP